MADVTQPDDSLPTCQVCGSGIAAENEKRCQLCDTPHHVDCWDYNRGCSTYGCQKRPAVHPPPARLPGQPRPPEWNRAHPPSSQPALGFLIFALLGVLSVLFLSPPLKDRKPGLPSGPGVLLWERNQLGCPQLNAFTIVGPQGGSFPLITADRLPPRRKPDGILVNGCRVIDGVNASYLKKVKGAAGDVVAVVVHNYVVIFAPGQIWTLSRDSDGLSQVRQEASLSGPVRILDRSELCVLVGWTGAVCKVSSGLGAQLPQIEVFPVGKGHEVVGACDSKALIRDSNDRGQVSLVELPSARVLWKQQLPNDVNEVVWAGGRLWAGGFRLHILDEAAGTPVSFRDLGDSILHLEVQNQVVAVLTTSHRLMLLNTRTMECLTREDGIQAFTSDGGGFTCLDQQAGVKRLYAGGNRTVQSLFTLPRGPEASTSGQLCIVNGRLLVNYRTSREHIFELRCYTL